MEHYFKQAKGVLKVMPGYIGGSVDNPSYTQVKSHTTGHAEAVMVDYDSNRTDYRTLAMLFFEIHDPEQIDRQGIDIGNQYRSEVFYLNEDQKKTAEELIGILKKKGYEVATKVSPATTFWPAEEYHRDYFSKNGGEPDCHFYTKRF